MKLFVAVATGQNVANLPPVLQFAQRGDEVLWLESKQAADQDWAVGAIEVLRSRHVESRRAPINGNINDPKAVRQALEGFLVDHHERYRELNLVLNGGQKLTPFGLALAADYWRNQCDHPVRFLYGDDRPARVQVRETAPDAPMHQHTYDRARMPSLVEVLKARGSSLEEAGLPLEWNSPPSTHGL